MINLKYLTLIFKNKKRGDLELETIIKLILVVIALAVALFFVSVTFFEGGGKILDSIRDIFRFGR